MILQKVSFSEVEHLLKKAERWGDGQTAKQVCKGCELFAFFDEKKPVFAFALCQKNGGLWVQIAAGRAEIDLTEAVLKVTEAMAKADGYQSTGFQTRRRGLVRKGEKLGYQQLSNSRGWSVMVKRGIQ